MVIGIDVDGVIQDTENWFRAYAEMYDMEFVGGGIIDPEANRVENRYGWEKHGEMLRFMHRYGFDVERNAPLLPGIREVLGKLKEMGHTLVVVTARGSIDPLEEEILAKRLEQENLPFDEVCVRCFDKVPTCREKGVDILIDDGAWNIDAVSGAGIKCLYMRGQVGDIIDHPLVTTVKNWGEVLRYFENLK